MVDPKSASNNTADLKCDKCNYETTNESYLAVHMAYSHQDSNVFESVENKNEISNKRTESEQNTTEGSTGKAITVECKNGSNITSNLPDVKEHAETDHEKVSYKCWHCNFTSLTKVELRYHINSHVRANFQQDSTNIGQKLKNYDDMIGNFKCDLCDYTTAMMSLLARHKKYAHTDKVRKFPCEYCVHSSTSVQGLKQHIASVHFSDKKYKCNQCDHATARKANLESHIRAVHEKIRTYRCAMCPYSAARRNNFASHMMKAHKRILQDGGGEEINSVTLPKSSPNVNLKEFQSTQCRDPTEELPENVTFPLMSSSEETTVIKYEDTTAIKSETETGKIYCCDICGSIYDIFKTISGKSVMCRVCLADKSSEIKVDGQIVNIQPKISHVPFDDSCITGGSTDNEPLEEDHLSMSNSKGSIICNRCDFRTKKPSHLTYHIKIQHEGVEDTKLYKCSECDHATARKGNLKTHIREVHTKIRSYRCNVCPYSSARKIPLATHMMKTHKRMLQNLEGDEIDSSLPSKSSLLHVEETMGKDPANEPLEKCKCKRQKKRCTGKCKRQHTEVESTARDDPTNSPIKLEIDETVQSGHAVVVGLGPEHEPPDAPGLIRQSDVSGGRPGPYRCDGCGSTQDIFRTLDGQSIKCRECLSNIDTKNILANNYRVSSDDGYTTGENADVELLIDEAAKGKESHTCNKCDFVAEKRAHLTHHMNVAHEGVEDLRLQKCDLCTYSAKRKGQLTEHRRRVHERLKRFKCKMCDFADFDKANLFRHVKRYHPGAIDSALTYHDWRVKAQKAPLQSEIYENVLVRDPLRNSETHVANTNWHTEALTDEATRSTDHVETSSLAQEACKNAEVAEGIEPGSDNAPKVDECLNLESLDCADITRFLNGSNSRVAQRYLI